MKKFLALVLTLAMVLTMSVSIFASTAVAGSINVAGQTTVTVDGVEHRFENVWLSPLMLGRYCGGGMKAAPAQKRDSGELSVVVVHGAGKLRLLTILPSVFTGDHIKYEKYVSVFTGKEIKISYDVPKPVQIDGEVFSLATDITAKVYSEE